MNLRGSCENGGKLERGFIGDNNSSIFIKGGEKMKKISIVAFLVFFLGIPAMVAAQKCDVEKSPTMHLVTLDGKEVPFCNLEEAYVAAFVKREGATPFDLNDQVVPIKARDFETKEMFNFYDGFYIIESTIEIKDSAPPYIPGFATREKAWAYWEKHQAQIGGRVVNFETATREYAKAQTPPKKELTPREAAAQKHIELYQKKGK